MGPPPEGGGDVIIDSGSALQDKLQWGRLPKEAETGHDHRQRAGDARRFDGAASRRRRRPDRLRTRAGEEPASMGPPPEGGGDAARPHKRPAVVTLQWGRLPKEAETATDIFAT